jgi:hypothetical protein
VIARTQPALLAVALPLLLAGGTPAPSPPDGFASGVNGVARASDGALQDARAAGFDAIRVFLRWDQIETVEGAPDWTCKYTTDADVGRDLDGDGVPDPWPGTPCDGTPCGCGYSADERVAAAAGGDVPPAVLLTLVGTPAWARGQPAASCPDYAPARARPLRRGKEAAFRDFAAAVASRYGSAAYAFELWNEPDLAGCVGWAGTPEQYKNQILKAARAIKATGVTPGLVVAPTLENPSGSAMDTWMDWSEPVDVVSFNLYTTSLGSALAKIEEMNGWCGANRRCPGFYVTEFGARKRGASDCPGPRHGAPGAADVALMRRCRNRRSCAGFFLYALSDQKERPECDRGLLDTQGCRKRRLCTIARRFFGVTPPYACVGCGP